MFNHDFFFQRLMQHLRSVTFYEEGESAFEQYVEKYGWEKCQVPDNVTVYRAFDIEEDSFDGKQLPLYIEVGCGYIDQDFRDLLNQEGYHTVSHGTALIAFKPFTRVPNIMHFVNIRPLKFSLIHYLSIMSAYHTQQPDVIYVYVDEEPPNNRLWDVVKKYVTVEHVEACWVFRGVPLQHPQYVADIIRLEKMIERGGIYLDMDNLTIKPFHDLMNYRCVMPGRLNTDDGIPNYMSISTIIAEPNNRFLTDWFGCIEKHLDSSQNKWAEHSSLQSARLIASDYPLYRQHIRVLTMEKYFGDMHWTQKIWVLDPNDKSRESELKHSYILMFYQTIQGDKLLSIDTDFIRNTDCYFANKFRHLLKYGSGEI